jgi:pyruvate/2-oxoglutarate/acetoin dehydrogenase E1 component
VPEDEYTIPIGQAKVVEEGTDLTVVTWGATTLQVIESLDSLPDDLSVEVIDLRTIYPYDMDTVADSVQKTGRCVIACEAPRTAGMAAELAAAIQEECFLHLQAPVQRVTGFDTVMPYYKLELDYLPDAKRISRGIMEAAGY